jgi:hypothetical protein
MRGVSFLWYRVRKFELMYFLDQNREFQLLSIHVTTPMSCKVSRNDRHPPCLDTDILECAR